MSKHIKSTDPRKAAIVKALKEKSGGTKITLVREIGLNTFEGRCWRQELIKHDQGFVLKTGKYEALGNFTVVLLFY